MTPEKRIANRCPSCGCQTIFVGSGGSLMCSNLECKNPCVSLESPLLRENDEKIDELECALSDEEAAHQQTLRLWNEAKAQLAEVREKAIRECLDAVIATDARIAENGGSTMIQLANMQRLKNNCENAILALLEKKEGGK